METIHKLIVPTPFPVGPVNVYLLAGDPLTLVDTGPDTPEALEAMIQQLDKLGYCISDLKQIIITHAHHDHFGLVGKLVQRSQAVTLVHPKAANWLEDHEQTWQKTIDYFIDLYRQAGLEERIIQRIAENSPDFNTLVESAPVGRVLENGEIIRVGQAEWQVIYTPGHSDSAICLYNQEKKLLISGDHLLRNISSNPVLEPPELKGVKRNPSLPKHLDSLRLVADLEIKEVLPGHGKNILDHRQVIAQRLEEFKQRQNEVYSLINGKTKTAFQICLDLFPQIDDNDIFLGLSEAFNHLDILVEQGLIEKKQNGEIELFSALREKQEKESI